MRVVFMGTPEFAVPSLERLLADRYEVVAVYTQPDQTAGRGRALSVPPVKAAALKWGVPVRQPVSLRSAAERGGLAALQPDVAVVAAFGQILTQAVLEIPPHGFLNIHPSLLPAYRGVAPVPAAILNGDEFTGVTVMQLDRGVDTGPVLLQGQVPVAEHDTAASLMDKLARVGAALLLEALPRWADGRLAARAQDDTKASYTRMIQKEAGEIDWTQPAVKIWRQVRAYCPWPGSWTRWQSKQIKVLEAVPLAGGGGTAGGVVPLEGGAGFGVETGQGILRVTRVQMEGKRAMTAGDFLRGQRGIIGATLPG